MPGDGNPTFLADLSPATRGIPGPIIRAGLRWVSLKGRDLTRIDPRLARPSLRSPITSGDPGLTIRAGLSLATRAAPARAIQPASRRVPSLATGMSRDVVT